MEPAGFEPATSCLRSRPALLRCVMVFRESTVQRTESRLRPPTDPRSAALGGADIDERLVLAQGNWAAIARAAPGLRHGTRIDRPLTEDGVPCTGSTASEHAISMLTARSGAADRLCHGRALLFPGSGPGVGSRPRGVTWSGRLTLCRSPGAPGLLRRAAAVFLGRFGLASASRPGGAARPSSAGPSDDR
jgi:hypothetical protein